MNDLRKKLIALIMAMAITVSLTPSLGLAYAEDESADAPAAAVAEEAADQEDYPEQEDTEQQDANAGLPEETAQIIEEDPAEDEPVITDVIESETERLTPDEEMPEPEELYDGYLKMKAYGARAGKTVGGRLKGANKGIYNYVNAEIAKVAAGSRASTIFKYSAESLFGGKNYWTASELGLRRLSDSNGNITETAKKTCQNLGTVLNALLADNPYGLYWYDKTRRAYGVSFSCHLETKDGEERLVVTGSGYIKLPVAAAYSSTKGLGTYEFDTGIGKSASGVASKAQAIVDIYEGVDDTERLTKYGDEICRLVSYNRSAAASYSASDDSTPYGDPWQLIWVFDGDPSTDVVCEGYAKAFKFLCDLTDFSSSVDCIVVTGDMGGAGHMWNVVTPADGYNYIVDLTNSDGGSRLFNSGVFMCNTPASEAYPSYYFRRSGSQIKYTYDEDCTSVFCRNELAIPGDGTGHEPAEDHYLVKIEAVPASCTRAGNIEHYMCSKCELLFADKAGKEAISENETIVKALGHTKPVYVKTKAATCEETGVKAHYECSRCGTYLDKKGKLLSAKAKKKLNLKKKAHSYKKKVIDDKYLKSKATCTKKAKYYYSCKCGRKGKKTFAAGKALGHSYEMILTPATAAKDGSIAKKCSRCHKKAKTTKIYKASKVSIPKKYQTVVYKGNNTETTTVTVKNRKNKTISKAYYDLKFENDYVNKEGTAVITFKGNYSGTITLKYKITGIPD